MKNFKALIDDLTLYPSTVYKYLTMLGVCFALSILFASNLLMAFTLLLWCFYLLALGIQFHLSHRFTDYCHWLYLAIELHAMLTAIFILIPHDRDPKPPRRRQRYRANNLRRVQPVI